VCNLQRNPGLFRCGGSEFGAQRHQVPSLLLSFSTQLGKPLLSSGYLSQ
jgi:hypothetical protein